MLRLFQREVAVKVALEGEVRVREISDFTK